MSKGPLIILSGPSGSGKSTVTGRLLARADPPLRLSVSVTTRPRRGSEREDVHYHFWTREQFERGIAEGKFLEYAEVFGNYYGTPREEVEPHRERGVGVILEIDVQGAAQVRRHCPDAVAIFLHVAPGGVEEELRVLEARLRGRATESEEVIRRRLATARQELLRAGEYDYQVLNDDLDRAVAEIRAIIVDHWRGAAMLDELKEEGIVNKVGGRFKLSTLIQKRMVALNTGAKALVDVKGGDKMSIVVQEILQDKIYLDANNQVRARGTGPGDAARRAMLTDISDSSGGDD
jgi:guanylate kinase